MLTLHGSIELPMTFSSQRKSQLLVWMVLTFTNSFSQKITAQLPGIAPSLLTHEVHRVLLITSDSSVFLNWSSHQPEDLTLTRLGKNLFQLTNKRKFSIADFHTMPGVHFIDRADRIAVEETILGNFDHTLNGTTAVHSLYEQITGDAITLSIKEKPFDHQDLDVRGRVKLSSQFDEPPTLHATFMATLAGGGGNSNPVAKGAAWGSSLTTSDFSRLLPDPSTDLLALNVSIQNHSYGVGLENYYGVESAAYDQAVIDNPKILHIFSSGNAGDNTPPEGTYQGLPGVANLTGQFKVSKNTLAVGSSDRNGNVVPKSSRGPAYDGRIKPELLAFGDAGSSESAAVVSGIAALVQNHFLSQNLTLPDAALVKAILINSALDTGRPQVDYESGYGNVDALYALRTVERGSYFEATIQDQEEIVVSLPVPTNQAELRITLVWSDPPADPVQSNALVNDLDMSLNHPNSGQVWHPWILNPSPALGALKADAVRGADHLNNVEQITVSFPEAGTYQLTIAGHNVPVGPQKFFIAYEFRNGFEWTFPQKNDAMASGTTTLLRWHWQGVEDMAVLAYRFDSESNWTVLEPNLNLKLLSYDWQVPDTTALVQLRLSIGSDQYESVVFPISRPDRLTVGFNCDDNVMLTWRKNPQAESYVLYSLRDQYLEPFLSTSDTLAIIVKSQTNQHFSVAPVVGGKTGLRELTIDYGQQGTGCYLVSFRAEQYLVTDTARFYLELGTTYQLQSILLERNINGIFQPIESIMNPTSPSLILKDPAPFPGIGMYRVQLKPASQASVFSQEEVVFYAEESGLYVYPNPVQRTDVLSIVIDSEEAAIIRIYDVYGRLIRGIEDTGAVKSMDLSDFKGGTYLLRVFKNDGRILTSRLIIL